MGSLRGALTLGSLETTAALRLAPVLTRFVAEHPGVDLVLRTGTTCELIDEVLARRVEGAFVCGPVDHPALDVQAAFEEELVLLAAPQCQSLRAALGAGDARIVVLKAGCSYRQRLQSFLAKRGVQAPRLLEFGTLEAIFKCVAAGLGITLLPRSVVERMGHKGAVSVHTLPRSEARVQTLFVRRRDVVASSALMAFLKCAQATQGQAASPRARCAPRQDARRAITAPCARRRCGWRPRRRRLAGSESPPGSAWT